MRRKISKLMSLGLALSLMTVPAMANETITTSKTHGVTLNASLASDFEVTLPKTITLSKKSGNDFEGSIPVTVKGNIATDEVVKVTTSTTVTLTDSSNAVDGNLTANVTKGTETFNYEALAGGKTASTSHKVSATLKPGTYTGTLNFNISIGAAS